MSNFLKEGDFAPKIDSGGLLDIFNKYDIILYFYPKDDTPGCTIEANNFSSLIEEFVKLNVRVIGVSKDSKNSHDKFINKYNLKIDLIADEDKKLCNDYGILKEKSMFGKSYFGIDRTTFFIKKGGKINKIWKSVKAKGHAQTVLDYIKKEN